MLEQFGSDGILPKSVVVQFSIPERKTVPYVGGCPILESETIKKSPDSLVPVIFSFIFFIHHLAAPISRYVPC